MAASGFLISKKNERQNLLRANMMKTNLLVLFADTMSGCPSGVQRMAKTATIAPVCRAMIAVFLWLWRVSA